MEASQQQDPNAAAQPADRAATADQPAASVTDVAAVEAEIRAKLEAEYDQRLRTELAQRFEAGKPAQTSSTTTIDLSGHSQAQRADIYKDWPSKDGSDLPQPWDLRALTLHKEDINPGAPNTIAPIVIDHGWPILASGSADPVVHELGRMLAALGFENSVVKGENPFGAVDASVMGAVHAFRSVYNVVEDPTGFGGNTPAAADLAAAHIGPWTIEAIRRAYQREVAHAA